MDANQVIKEILNAVKPLTTTDRTRTAFIQDCVKSGITLNPNFVVSGIITETNINNLINNLSSPILKMAIRRVMRSHV